jgi:nitroreductase
MKTLLKKLIPASIVQSVREAKKLASRAILKLTFSNRLTASLYYLFAGDFSNEQHAVLEGRRAYYESLAMIGKSCALLRRNIHRLEKGLIMRPRRSVFAEKFIKETVNCYKQAMKDGVLDESELKWATDVLDEYFSVVGESLVVAAAHDVYVASRCTALSAKNIDSILGSEYPAFKPYSHNSLPSISLDFDTLRQLFIRRRSVRWYQARSVPVELVIKAASIATFAPSACNRQPYRFLFCGNGKRAVEIAKCAGGTAGFAENLPSMIVVVGDLSAYPFERDRHLIYIDGSLATMQLILALETLGLSTCCINWPDIDSSERKIRSVVKLKEYERVIMLLAVGYADVTGGIPYSQKKASEMILEEIAE